MKRLDIVICLEFFFLEWGVVIVVVGDVVDVVLGLGGRVVVVVLNIFGEESGLGEGGG